MKKRTKISLVLSSAAAILLAGSIMAGGTYALFTSESKTNIAVNSGTVNVSATVKDLQTYSGVDLTGEAEADASKIYKTDSTELGGTNGIFTNGGTAKYEDGTLKLDKMTPGDKVTFNIKVTNHSNVAVKYRTKMTVSDGGLYDALTITIDDVTFDRKVITEYKVLEANKSPNDIKVTVDMPSSIGNDYQDLSCALNFVVEAIQGNAVGEADTYPVYPAGLTTSSFESATSVYYYYYNLDHFEVRTATSADDLNKYPAVVAYVDVNGNVQYASDITTATEQGATTIYCKEKATVKMLVNNTTSPQVYKISKDQTLNIYGNGAEFNGGRFDIITDVGTVDLKIYDVKNVYVLGETTAVGNIVNVSLENCHNVGESAIGQAGRMFYSSDRLATTNLTLDNCSITKADSAVYINGNGSLTVKNTIIRRCATGIKASHKTTSGTLEINVTDTGFYNCGADKTTYPGAEAYCYEDSSAIKCKTNSSDGIELNLTNVAVNNTIGGYAFHIDDDEHDTKYTGSTTVDATNVTVDGVEYNFNV